jgi:microcystin degradation protein MlrC
VVPSAVLDTWISRVTQIFMVELVATVLVLETFRHYLQDATVLLFVDAEAVEGALVKGYSARSDVSLLVGKFWQLAQELNVYIYVDRVPTDANCSDGPSRDKVHIGKQLGWLEVQARWPAEVHKSGRAWGPV